MRLFALMFFGLSLAVTAFSAKAETLVLGSVNDDVRKHIERLTPLALYLEDALADHGISDVRISVLPDSEAMSQALRDGEVDLYFDSPLVAGHVARLADAQPFLRRWKGGVATYHSVIIVPTDSTIETFDDLRGKIIGFQEPDSTSGFMLPAAMIRQNGIELTELTGVDQQAPDTTAGFVFTDDDRNTVLWLVRGQIDAGATDPQGFAWLEEAQPGRYRILERSIDVPRQVVIGRNDLDPDLSQQIATVLRGMVETPEGRDTMARFHDTTRFDDFPGGVEATFDPIYQLLDQLDAMGLI